MTNGRARDREWVHVAVVLDDGGVRLMHVAATRAALMERVVAYVAEQEPAGRLWPPDASRLATLLAAGEVDAAVDHYFESAGRRWDGERLMVQALELDRTDDGDRQVQAELSRIA